MEFQLNRLNSSSISINLTPTQFEWIMDCVESHSGSKVVPGDDEEKFICFENPDNKSDDVICVSVIDRRAKFGVAIRGYEASTLETNAKMLLFVMKYQQPSNDILKDAVYHLTSSVIAEKMKSLIEGDCNGCREKSSINNEHTCLNYYDKVSLDELFNRILDYSDYKQEFKSYFEYYANLLNIDHVLRQQAVNVYFPMIIGDTNLFESVLEFYNKKQNNWKINAILLLNLRKKEIDVCGKPIVKKLF